MVRFRARIDRQPVVAWSRDKYSNELMLRFFDGWEKIDILGPPLGKNEMPPAGSLSEGAYAHRILVELPLPNGDRPIVDIRLDDPVFRKFVAGCRFPRVKPPVNTEDINIHNGEVKIHDGEVTISAELASTMRIGGKFPQYPAEAKAAGLSGTVVFQALIGSDGTVHRLTPATSPSPSLTAAATDAVRAWRYRPFLMNNIPAAVETAIHVTFSLGR